MSNFDRALKRITAPEDLPNEKEWKEFYISDDFNAGNTLEGYLCRQSTRFYGALLITHVNNVFEPQLIFCTPKLHYPFDKHGNYHFPKARKIEVRDKLDGTNILAYTYTLGGRTFIAYKTRLTVVVRDTEHYPFRALLDECIDYQAVQRLVEESGCNLSFELYGAKNKHLIEYSEPISLALLFGVDKEGKVYPSSHFKSWVGEQAKLFPEVSGNYVETYNWHRQEDESKLKEVDNGYEGTEGRVWYMLTEGMKWVMFKCKPESIEKIHWAHGGLGNNIIRATAYNVLETEDEITYKAVKELLLEEFDESKITFAKDRIHKVIAQINEEIRLREELLKEYDAIGISIHEDKGAVMRIFSKRYEKAKMRRIYSTIIAYR